MPEPTPTERALDMQARAQHHIAVALAGNGTESDVASAIEYAGAITAKALAGDSRYLDKDISVATAIHLGLTSAEMIDQFTIVDAIIALSRSIDRAGEAIAEALRARS